MVDVVRADRDRVDPREAVGGTEGGLDLRGGRGVSQEDPRIEAFPHRLGRTSAEGAHAPHLRRTPPHRQGLGRFEDVDPDQQPRSDHKDISAWHVEVHKRARIPGRDAPGPAKPRLCCIGQDRARLFQRLGVGCRVLWVVEKYQIRLPPKILDGLLDGYAEPGGSEAVPLGEIPDLGGDREFRQKIACRRLQDLVGAMTQVVGRGVEACYIEVGGCFE